MERAKHILISLFILATLSILVWVNQSRPRVFILHSYNTDYSWTREIDDGLMRVFGKSDYLLTRSHYMNLKKHPWEDYKIKAGLQARRSIEKFKPDVLIAFDDDAQKFAAKYFVNHPSMKIVFAGLNGESKKYGYDGANNVTGIYERVPVHALIDTIKSIVGQTKAGQPAKTFVIGDKSGSVTSDMKHFTEANWKDVQFLGGHQVETFDQWKKLILEQSGDVDVVISANYRKLKISEDGKDLVSAKEVVKWTTTNSKAPVLGINGYFVADGGMLAVGASGYEQGEVAAQMALDIISNKTPATSVPRGFTKQYILYMRGGMIEQKGLTLPSYMEAFARATNNYHE